MLAVRRTFRYSLATIKNTHFISYVIWCISRWYRLQYKRTRCHFTCLAPSSRRFERKPNILLHNGKTGWMKRKHFIALLVTWGYLNEPKKKVTRLGAERSLQTGNMSPDVWQSCSGLSLFCSCFLYHCFINISKFLLVLAKTRLSLWIFPKIINLLAKLIHTPCYGPFHELSKIREGFSKGKQKPHSTTVYHVYLTDCPPSCVSQV